MGCYALPAAGKSQRWQVCLLCVAMCLSNRAGAAGEDGSAPSDAASNHAQYFDIVFEDSVLGLQLSPEMIVTGFAAASATGARQFVRVGDAIISVNGKSVNGLPAAQALGMIRSATLPKNIRFLSYSSIKRDSGRVTASPSALDKVPDDPSANTLLILDADIGLVARIRYSEALFGAWGNTSGSCRPYYLAFAEPNHACAALTVSSSVQMRGKIAVVKRGSCSFLSKAWQVFQNGAVGVLVLNSDNTLVAMPAESKALAEGLHIPVVMVRSADTEALKNAATSGFLVQMYNSKLCGSHEMYGHVDDVIAGIRNEIDASVQLKSEVDAYGQTENDDVVLKRGGILVFSSPSVMANGIKADFLQFLSGPRLLPKGHVRVVWADPPGGCESLSNIFTQGVKSFVLVERGHGCSFASKLSNAESAGAVGVIIVNDMEHGMTHGSSGAATAFGTDSDHSIPAVMITRSAARSLRVLSTSAPVILCKFVARKNVPILWAELSALSHLDGWPTTERDRRALYKRLAKIHHPDKGTGSVERFEWLRYQFRSLSTEADLQ